MTLELQPVMWVTGSGQPQRPFQYEVLGLPAGERALISEFGHRWSLRRDTPNGSTTWYGSFDSHEAARDALASDLAAGVVQQWPLEVSALVRGTAWSAEDVQVFADSTRRTAVLEHSHSHRRLKVDFYADHFPTPESRFEMLRRAMVDAER
jgi:hypothetical protein